MSKEDKLKIFKFVYESDLRKKAGCSARETYVGGKLVGGSERVVSR